MGFGDAIMASALARGLHAQGKRAAFFVPGANPQRIKWTGYCDDIFTHNPNIARPDMERQPNLVWFPHYKKIFPYCSYDGPRRKWIWKMDFKAQPGEFFFTPEELALPLPKPFIVIEPNIAWQRQVNHNKDWGEGKYEKLARMLIDDGHTVVQFIHGNSRRRIDGAHQLPTPKFHQAAAMMSSASLIIAPEGANHHAAAALGVPAVIVWGDWSPTETMGYDGQIKLTGSNPRQACGNTYNCTHCRNAMNNISVDEVYRAAKSLL
jgi:Glycosyltransferase family 9 (heptosyltransferase)